MSGIINEILYSKQKKVFKEVHSLAKTVSYLYGGNPIIRDGIYTLINNYARKKEIPVQMLRYPFNDEDLWAFTFLKKGTIFLCINTQISLCKQNFAAAHELYHLYCFCENVDQNLVRNGTILSTETVEEVVENQEELEANAFAGVLLMPSSCLRDQIEMLEIDINHIMIDDILALMDVFAIPYKACILRLYECDIISASKAEELYTTKWEVIKERILLTGQAKRWQLDGAGTEQFGSLFADFNFNVENDFLVDTREESDREYISSLKKRFHLDEVDF